MFYFEKNFNRAKPKVKSEKNFTHGHICYWTIFPVLELGFFAFAMCQKQTNALKCGVINEG